ncbi:hypothetical protein SpCBS45565_g00584 [Spizellomyces sp. 'palustris']|nr:hypothetical protein SpCBS45565_g00584 [Spizellomyces sp. 'palustris']
MAVNIFRLTVLAVCVGIGVLVYQYTGGQDQSARVRRAAIERRQQQNGVCLFDQFYANTLVENKHAFVYDTPKNHADAITACANAPGGPYELGKLTFGDKTSYDWNAITTYFQNACPDANAALAKDKIVWIGSWNGDSYNGACMAVTLSPKGKMAINVRPCEDKHPVWCTKTINQPAMCQQCSPTPGGAQCHGTASCTKYLAQNPFIGTTNLYQCACRSGYKAAANQPAWRVTYVQRSANDDLNRVHVPPGVACDTLCDNPTLSNRCDEVANTCEGCFPGDATVRVEKEGKTVKVPFREVKPGMKVMVAVGEERTTGWSEVAFVVNLSGQPAFTDVEYVTDDGKTGKITLTATHLIAADVEENDTPVLVQAMHIKIGQQIYHQAYSRVTVTATNTHTLPPSTGAYTLIPNTPSALLFVDDVLVSPYSSHISHHETADRTFGMLARVLYRSLKVIGKEEWMGANVLQNGAEWVRPWFMDVAAKMEEVASIGSGVVAAILGLVVVKRVTA